MRRQVLSFRGEAPRVSPRGLPDNAAQAAINASLFTGDLRSYRQFAPELGLANPGIVRTIYKLVDAWLSWEADVDVARGTVAGDTTYRTYLTGPAVYSEPRFTNYALATTGAQPYPVTTRPLGVPAPESAPGVVVEVGTTPTISVSDEGDQLSGAWVTSPVVSSGSTISNVTQDGAIGNPVPSYRLQYANNVGYPCYAYRNFGVEEAVAVNVRVQVAFTGVQIDAGVRVRCTAAGSGIVVGVGVISGSTYLFIGTATEWGGVESPLAQAVLPAMDNTASVWYDIDVRTVLNEVGTLTVRAAVYQGSSLLAETEATGAFDFGGFCGVDGVTSSVSGHATYYDNFLIEGSGSSSVVLSTATSYVYTFVNDLDQESAPSPASATVLRPDGLSITVTTPVAIPSGMSADYGINKKRIYRAVTGNLGTVFRFVAEIDLTTADYIDELTDSELGETLLSELWALPPTDLKGIIALPNGVMAGFSKNQLCFSAQNYPHAWPVEYRLNTDTDIVGIGNVDTTVVVGTQSFVYSASGNDPAAYSMSKFEVPYACTSKRSIAYLTGIGVVFAGPDGLMAVTGPGQVRNLTDPVFTREQWQALNPASIHGVAHNDVYWMFWESGSLRGCYALDMKQNGAGVIQMAFHAAAAYVDPIEDKMYLVLDEDTEPDDVLLPVPADPPAHIDGRTIFEFEGNPVVRMNYRWRSKLWLLEHPAWLSVFQVKAEDYDNILLRIYGDGVQIEELVVEGETEFTVTQTDLYTTLEVEVLGSSPVRVIQGAEDVKELD